MTKTAQYILVPALAFGMGCNSSPKQVESKQETKTSYVDETPAYYSDTLAITPMLDSLTQKQKLEMFKQILPKAKKMDDYSTFSSTESAQTFQNVLHLMQNYQDSSDIRKNNLQSIYKELLEKSKEEFEANPIDIKTKLELAAIKSEINEIIARSKQNSNTIELMDTMSK